MCGLGVPGQKGRPCKRWLEIWMGSWGSKLFTELSLRRSFRSIRRYRSSRKVNETKLRGKDNTCVEMHCMQGMLCLCIQTELFEHLPSSAYLSYRWLIYQLLSIVSSSPHFFFIYLSLFVASTGYEALFFPFAYEDLTKTSCKNHPVELLLRLRRERDR